MADSDPDLAGAVTIEAPRRRLRRLKESDQLAQSARRRVALVEGSTPHLSSETRSLLRKRLRMAALLLGAGFGLFFLWLIIQGAATGDWIISARSTPSTSAWRCYLASWPRVSAASATCRLQSSAFSRP